MQNTTVTCEECEEPLSNNRPNKKFCSGRCRSKAFRRFQKEKMNLLERLFAKLPEPTNAVKDDLFA
jgi:endogenous inhibitor of DNA gyrase (YacG/DUF329 family)